MTLLCCLTVPLDRLCAVLGNAVSVFITFAQMMLCVGMTLLRCLAIPRDRLCGVFRHALPVVIAHAQIELCIGTALLRGQAMQVEVTNVVVRCRVILALPIRLLRGPQPGAGDPAHRVELAKIRSDLFSHRVFLIIFSAAAALRNFCSNRSSATFAKLPLSAALRYHAAASASSFGTPCPFS